MASACFEIENVTPAKVALESDELYGSGLPRVVGNSDALRRVLDMVRVVAPTGATVLLNGETGTGKELIAAAIHKYSDRSNGPFVKVNCAAIPAGLLESELFGHERGAYTGAVARGIGRFERANRGTLFLDEIGDLPLELQPKLLRVMQERQFERLGGTATIRTDVRVICATHRNLIEMVDERQFRIDLFYRLSVFPIELPPLRELTGTLKLSAAVTLEEAERSHILQTLQQTEGVVGGRDGAAARLGLRRTTLIAKMKRLGIHPGQSSALPVGAAASVPMSEDPIFRIPPLSEISHEAASSGNSKPQSDLG